MELARLYYLACELKPVLPGRNLMTMLGRTWANIIYAGATYGLAGSQLALPSVSLEQLTNLYMSGSESGAALSLDEFKAAIANSIYEKITESELTSIEQIKLITQLNRYIQTESFINEEIIDFDADVSIPMFTKSGFWPIDTICGDNGIPQEIITLLAKPEQGKTTVAVSLAAAWKRNNIGPVTFIQTELSPSAMRMKIDDQTKDEGLWESGIDRLVFGRSTVETVLDLLVKEPDPDRLVIFDSVTGYCGQGDEPSSRTAFFELYSKLSAIKNTNRLVVACTHLKRNEHTVTIESAGGSSIIERQSGVMIVIEKDTTKRLDGKSAIKIETVKNRYSAPVTPFKFTYDYTKGIAETYGDEYDY